jgi:hypothetical protein
MPNNKQDPRTHLGDLFNVLDRLQALLNFAQSGHALLLLSITGDGDGGTDGAGEHCFLEGMIREK